MTNLAASMTVRRTVADTSQPILAEGHLFVLKSWFQGSALTRLFF